MAGHETNYLQEVKLRIPPGIAIPADMLSPDAYNSAHPIAPNLQPLTSRPSTYSP